MSDQLFSLLVLQTWQVTVLTSLVWIATRCFAKDRPHLAHALWALVLIKCIVPPIWSSPVSPFSWLSSPSSASQQLLAEPSIADPAGLVKSRDLPSEMAVEGNAGDVNRIARNPATTFSPPSSLAIDKLPEEIATSPKPSEKHIKQKAGVAPSLKSVVLSVWWGGVLVGLLTTLVRFSLFVAWLRRSTHTDNSHVNEVLQRLARHLNIQWPVRVAVLENSVGPAVLGVIRPTILLPAAIVAGKSSQELEPLLAHELIHVRRGDLWWAMLQTLATSLLWFHPLVWLASRAVTRESERSCDEETVACLGCQPAVYARGLLEVLEQKHLLRVAPALPGVRPVEITTARLERVMRLGKGIHNRTPIWNWAVLLVCGALVLPGAKLIWAQEGKPIESSALPEAYPVQPPLSIATAPEAPSVQKTVSADVSDLLTTIRDSKPKNETAEQILLAHLRIPVRAEDGIYNLRFPVRDDNGTYTEPLDLAPKMLITEGKLVVTGSAAKVDSTLKQLGWYREYGFGQVIVESRFINLPASKLEALEVKWSLADANVEPHAMAELRETAQSFKGQLAAFADFQDDGSSRIHATSYVERVSPVLYSVLDEEQSKSLLAQLRQHRWAAPMQAPTVTLFNGQEATVSDISRRPFVVGVESAKEAKTDSTSLTRPKIKLIEAGTSVFIKPVVNADIATVNCSIQMKDIGKVDGFDLSSGASGTESQPLQVPTVSTIKIDVCRKLPVGHSLLVNAIAAGFKGETTASIVMLTCRYIANPWESEQPAANIAASGRETTSPNPAPSFLVRLAKPEPTAVENATPDEDILIIRSKDNATLANGQPRVQVLQIFGHEVRLEGEVRLELDSERALFRGKNLTFNWESVLVSGDEGQLEVLPTPPGEIVDGDVDMYISQLLVTGNARLNFDEEAQGSADKIEFKSDFPGAMSLRADGNVKFRSETGQEVGGRTEIREVCDVEADHLSFVGDGLLVLEGKSQITRKNGDAKPVSFRADRLEWNMETDEINAVSEQD